MTGGRVTVNDGSWLGTRGQGGGQYIVSQHEGAGLDHKLMGLLVSDDGGCEPGRAAGFTAGVDGPRRKVLHVPEEAD